MLTTNSNNILTGARVARTAADLFSSSRHDQLRGNQFCAVSAADDVGSLPFVRPRTPLAAFLAGSMGMVTIVFTTTARYAAASARGVVGGRFLDAQRCLRILVRCARTAL